MSEMPSHSFFPYVKSDAGGKFTITRDWVDRNPAAEARREHLFVGRDLEHNLAATATITMDTTNMDLHLKMGLALSGSVQDSKGAALKMAEVSLYLMFASGSFGLVDDWQRRPATVDELGGFAKSALPQGQAYSLTVSVPGFGRTNVVIAATETARASLKLPPIKLRPADQRLEGRVLGTDDKPIPGASVGVIGPAGQPTAGALTDANGHFALKVCEGTVRVLVRAPKNINNANLQLSSSSVQAQAGDLDVVVKLGVANATPTAAPRGNNPVQPNHPPIIGPLL